MVPRLSLDLQVKERLKRWPQRPPGLPRPFRGKEAWLRGRPTNDAASCHPFLKLPGSDRMRTLPDGLWLNFGGTPEEPFVDIFAVEACGSMANLLDKRSRFAPSTHSLLAVCPLNWLLAPLMDGDPTPRWQATGLIRAAPAGSLTFPVRDMRVLYGLKRHDYAGFLENQLPHAHEMFAPMEVLSAQDSDKNPELQALLSRAAFTSNFLAPA
jgi:hypothetical protein